ncbi:flagellar motor protein [Noviherbaspirillum cavernae]|uniref:Flagellar motor protein n=1 Tax=Noviherbaspirillum cavernae TaxID=2320862 RepID=A0A418X0B5_9BURK|nr:flagellar motor protein [Noviherbaspirillum cavernae]RJG05929.1 flagellar motor protein [Noviherbaspirillum cavernae]
MDWASVAGLVLALVGIIAGRALEGGAIGALMQPAAFAIVVIGTCGAVLLQSGKANFVRGVKMLRWVFSPPVEDLPALTAEINRWSAAARREGLLSLERHLLAVSDPFVNKAMRLVVDGIDPNRIREILDRDISSFERHERQAVKIWEAAGGYAPTIGILGAVLGLIHVMENLSDPGKLGSGIAVAFVATIYGVGLANLVFLPIANKLKAIVAGQVARQEMMADVFFSIAAGDNARIIQERISAYR